MNFARQITLALGLLAGAGMAAYPPWLECRVVLPLQEWNELYEARSERAWGYASVWAVPQARHEDDFGFTFACTYGGGWESYGSSWDFAAAVAEP